MAENNYVLDNIEGAIFDLDGTIMDSMHIWSEVGIQYLVNEGYTPPKGLEDKFITMSLNQAAQYFVEHFDNGKTVEEVENAINKLVENFYFYEVPPKKDVPEFLEFLKRRNVKMCVATATDKYLVQKALERNDLFKYFSEIYTCTIVGAGKDTPVIYEKSLEHLGTKKESTFIFEDAFHAIKTAHNAGFKVVAIKDVSEKADETTIKPYCDCYISDFKEIYKYFSK